MGPKQSKMQFKNKEQSESYPGANRIEIMMVTRAWTSGDSQGQCTNKQEGFQAGTCTFFFFFLI